MAHGVPRMSVIIPDKTAVSSNQNDETSRYLTVYSPKDSVWDDHRSNTDVLSAMFKRAGLDKYAARTAECSGRLTFVRIADRETGEVRLKLREAVFCRVRNCLICQWRRTKLWMARFIQASPQLCLRYPTARFILLTLTVPNCHVSELRDTLGEMNKAWHRFIKLKELKGVVGWIRTTEVTREKKRTMYAHPHFHVLLMVPASYLSGHQYIKRERWLQMWQQAMRDPSITQVDVRAMKTEKRPKDAQEEAEAPHQPGLVLQELWDVASEVLKYAVKPADLIGNGPEDPESVEWLRIYVEQTHKLRFIATGGAFKDLFKEDPTDEELIHAGDELTEEEEAAAKLHFNWDRPVQKYRRKA